MKSIFLLLTLLGATFPALAGAPQSEAPQGEMPQSDLRDIILKAVQTKQTRLVIAPGVYKVGPRGNDQNLITLYGARDLEIVADGVTMLCTKRMRALEFNHCQNVVVRGLTVDYDPLTFTQGKVVAIAEDKGWLDVKIDAGYPQYLASRIVICDPKTRFHKYGINHLWGTQASWAQPGVIRITLKDVAQNVDLGDPVALSAGQEQGNCHGITVENGCSGVVFENLTLHCAPGMGIVEAGSEVALQMRGCKITPGPKPAGATEERLLTTSWDGIQNQAARVGCRIENCVIQRCGDDSWSVPALGWKVWSREADALLFEAPAQQLRVGDHLQFQNGPISQIVAIADVSREKEGKTVALRSISLDKPLAVEAGGSVFDLDYASKGFIYRGNQIYSHGRGALIKVGDGLIENNTFRGGDKAVIVNPEVGGLDGAISHLIIRGNTIMETGYHQAMPWSDQAGAIGISAVVKGGQLRPPGTFSDILIENNKFEGVKGLNLLLTSARGVVVRGNRFLKPHQTEPGRHNGADYHFDANAVIEIRQSDGVIFENNTVQRGPFTKNVLVQDATAQNVQGADTGLKIR